MKRRTFLQHAGGLLLATPLLGEEVATPLLFPKDGAPEGFVTGHWADVSQPAEGAVWEVKDGILQSTGDRGCWLLSEREYADFILEYGFKLGPRGNSGLALRAPAKGDPAFDGLELQMADLRYNPDARENELTGAFYRAAAPLEQVYKPEEWNTMRVELRGSKIRAELNGTLIQDIDLSSFDQPVKRHDGTDAPPLKDRPLRGRIGFQELSRDGGRTMIRRARLWELSKP